MSEPRRAAHRPGRYADLTAFIDAAGGERPERRAEMAAATAALVVGAGRDPDSGLRPDADLVALADDVGLETLAELWRGAEPVSLAGALWTVYLLRQWCAGHAGEVARIWRAGEVLDPVDVVVAGVSDDDGPVAVAKMADAVLGGVYRGELDVALERAAAMFRVIAAGRRDLADRADGAARPDLAAANERAAADLMRCAELWRAGTLR